ncbi:MAG TPA: hypothetical protein VIG80_08900 [Bacillaceae bacterium]
MKKIIIAMLAVMLVLAACNSTEQSEPVSEDQKIYNMMETAKSENRSLTQEEVQTIHDFYMNKPLDKRGTELDYTLNMMFSTFGTDHYEHFKDRAEKELNKEES